MRNIEIKIKLESDRKVKSILKEMGAKFEGEFIERDTFYHCPNGRLKLREIDGKAFKLIFYDRPNVAGSKMSEYWTVTLDDSQAMAMKMMLGDALGKQILVIKKRKLWLYENTRIHIDRVDGLSSVFLELETAVDEIGRKAAREEHARIIDLLGISFYIPLSASYADMLLEAKKEEGETLIAGRANDKDVKGLPKDVPAATIFAGHFNSERIMEAFKFASKAHEGQKRKGTMIPYIQHPLRVAKILIDQPCSVEAVIAGLLHDTVEDTPVTIEEIRATFGEEVARIVDGASEPDKSAPWEARKEHTINHLLNAPMDVVLVSCADKFDNLMEMHEAYQEVGEELWKRFRRPRDKQERYYRTLGEVFKKRMLKPTLKPLFYAYLNVVHKLFG